MSYRIHEIDRSVREAYHPTKSPAEEIRAQFMLDVDLDEAHLELFAQYVTALKGTGVNIQDEPLRDTLNAYRVRHGSCHPSCIRICPDLTAETPRFS